MKPWTTDGCSDFGFNSQLIAYADEELAVDILIACYKHDLAYWMGGPLEKRKRVDDAFLGSIRAAMQALQDRSKVKSDAYDVAQILQLVDDIYHLSVRVGGTPLLPTTWRWGYGHPWMFWWATVDVDMVHEAFNRLRELIAEARETLA